MKFRYGISPKSRARWEAFERIHALQAEHGPEVGGSVTRFIIDAELDAIEQATAECAKRETIALQCKR
jgi:hypothetical protein